MTGRSPCAALPAARGSPVLDCFCVGYARYRAVTSHCCSTQLQGLPDEPGAHWSRTHRGEGWSGYVPGRVRAHLTSRGRGGIGLLHVPVGVARRERRVGHDCDNDAWARRRCVRGAEMIACVQSLLTPQSGALAACGRILSEACISVSASFPFSR